jgi:quercetin dioxygenase-like cupin family protein
METPAGEGIRTMKNLNRRELGMALSAFAMMSSLNAEGQTGPAAAPGTSPQLLKSEIFTYDSLPVKTSSNGGSSRAVLHGTLATGEVLEVHETVLPPGQMPHPPHRHVHSELQLVREGQIQVLGEGPNGIIGPGGVIFNASGVLHGLKNVGDTPASYFVVAIGVQKMLPN